MRPCRNAGMSGRELLEATSVDRMYEDLVVLIRPDGLTVYCSPAAYRQVEGQVLVSSRPVCLKARYPWTRQVDLGAGRPAYPGPQHPVHHRAG